MFVFVAFFYLSKSTFYLLLVLQVLCFCYVKTFKFTEMKYLLVEKHCKCSWNRQQDSVEGNSVVYEFVIQSTLLRFIFPPFYYSWAERSLPRIIVLLGLPHVLFSRDISPLTGPKFPSWSVFKFVEMWNFLIVFFLSFCTF